MKRPLTGLVVVYAAGIGMGSLVHWPVVPLLWTAAGLLAVFLLLSRSRFSLPVLLLTVLVAGIAVERKTLLPSSANYITQLVEYRDQNARFRGVIVSEPGARFEVKLEAVEARGEWLPAEGRLMVFTSEDRPTDAWRYGDLVECSAILRVPPPARNPGGFNWREWLGQRGIAFTATIRKADVCAVLARDRGNPVTALSLRLRERFERALRLGLEDEPDAAGTLAGMVIGARSEIPTETYEQFQRTGVFHVFAINGLHVGLVTAAVVIFLRLVRVPRRWAALPAIPLLTLYVFATGAHPGAVRALVMASVWLIGGVLLRPVDLLNSLAGAALVILVWNPNQLFDGGFLLSFTVVASLVALTDQSAWWKFMISPNPSTTTHETWWMSLLRPDPFIPRQLVPPWRHKTVRLTTGFMVLASGSTAAWVGLVPLLAVYFHLFTPISIVANLLVIPLLSGVIALGLLATLVCGVWPGATLILNNANYFLLHVMTRGVDWLGRIPGSHWYVKAPPVWMVVAYYAVVLWLILWPKRRYAWAMATPVMTGMVLFCFWPENAAELTVLSLNDGACAFVNLPGERNDVLVDGGGDWSGKREVVPFLRAQGVDRLGTVVVTRGDKAHVAGLDAVAAEISIRKIVTSGVPTRSKYNAAWWSLAKELGLPVQQARAGDAWKEGGLKVRALNPPRIVFADRSDDNALVLLLEYGPMRVLMLSDAGRSAEQQILAENIRAQIIVKGRHGRDEVCTEALLDVVKPEVVVQSRYPEPELRERLQKRGIRFVRTDETGAATIRLTKDGYSIRSYLEAER